LEQLQQIRETIYETPEAPPPKKEVKLAVGKACTTDEGAKKCVDGASCKYVAGTSGDKKCKENPPPPPPEPTPTTPPPPPGLAQETPAEAPKPKKETKLAVGKACTTDEGAKKCVDGASCKYVAGTSGDKKCKENPPPPPPEPTPTTPPPPPGLAQVKGSVASGGVCTPGSTDDDKSCGTNLTCTGDKADGAAKGTKTCESSLAQH
jgi:hypothetical protein